MLFRLSVAWIATLSLAGVSEGALIANAGRAKTSGRVVVTTTKGQRLIAITIDPGVVTAFQLDVTFPNLFVAPVAASGIGGLLPGQAIDFIAPYGGAIGGGASILPMPGAGTDGLINNISGQASFPPGFAPAANRPDGGSDLFTLYFIDNAPTVDKVFTILGVDSKGIDPDLARYISDNYLDVYIDDPNDPLNGQIVRYTGEQIEAATIIVPGIPKDSSVPLPLSVWSGLIGSGVIAVVSRKTRRTAIDK
jgi:hypothetical protein